MRAFALHLNILYEAARPANKDTTLQTLPLYTAAHHITQLPLVTTFSTRYRYCYSVIAQFYDASSPQL